MSRLLTDEEIVALVKIVPTAAELVLARIARREQAALTLKEVGEWLNDHASCGEHANGRYTRVTQEHLAQLLQGRMPGGET